MWRGHDEDFLLLSLSSRGRLKGQTLIWWRCCWWGWSRPQTTSRSPHCQTRGWTKIKDKSNTNCVLLLSGGVIRITSDRVWTARVLSWRKAPEKSSKPGWPAKNGGKWSIAISEGGPLSHYMHLCQWLIQPTLSYSQRKTSAWELR